MSRKKAAVKTGFKIDAEWRCHTPNLMKEVLNNPTAWALYRPLQIFGGILFELAERARELDDPELNFLMMRLTLYEQGDPEAKGYTDKFYNEVRNQAKAAKAAREKK